MNEREMLCVPFTSIEIRDGGGGNDYFTLAGHAAVFGDVADLGAFREVLEPGCFRAAIDSSLVHLLWNHDTNFPLASTDSGTLDLVEDDQGLRVWARIPKALSYAPDLRTLMATGIARGMSFAFTLPADGSGETWTRSETEGEAPLRMITRVDQLYDVSAVTRGAYSAPSFAMRSALDEAIERGALPNLSTTVDPNLVALADPAGNTRGAQLDESQAVASADPVALADPAGVADVAIEPDRATELRASQLAALKSEAGYRQRLASARI